MAEWAYVVGADRYDYLTQEQIENNAVIIIEKLRGLGWTDSAIAGVLGNIQSEGIFNPGQGEVGKGLPSSLDDTGYTGGIGLIQWTKPQGGEINPLLKYASATGKNWYDGDMQVEYLNHADDALNYGLWGWIEKPQYPISFAEYKNFTGSAHDAAYIWVYNLERPADPDATASARAEHANTWYRFIQRNSFVPRLSYEGTDTLPYYTAYNPYWSWGTVELDDEYITAWLGMNNCTAYAFGRWNELAEVTALNYNWPTGDGADWVQDGIAKGFEHGNTPKLGAAISWKKRSERSNHVAIVEEIQYDENHNPVSFTISQSAFNHNQPSGRGPDQPGYNSFPWFWTDTVYMSNLDYVYGSGSFQGFIYHPTIVPSPIPPIPPTPPTPPGPTPYGKKMPLMYYLRKKFYRGNQNGY